MKSQSRILGRLVACGLVCFTLAGNAFAQPDTQRRLERAVRQADESFRLRIDPTLDVGERSIIDAGGTASMSFINLIDSSSNSRRLWQPEITLYGRAAIDRVHVFYVRSRFQYRAFSEGDSFDERGDQWTEPILDRYWYEFDLRRAVRAYEGREIDGTFNIRVGRQFVDWGAGLALSEQLIGARAVAEIDQFFMEAVAAVTPTDESIVDFDASRAEYNTDTERAFYGARVGWEFEDGNQIYGYYLRQQDYNSDNRARAALPFPVDFDYDSQYIGIGARGAVGSQFRYLGEFVYQIGESMSDPLRGPQTEEDIRAWAARGQMSYFFRDEWRSRLEFEVLMASGDDDRFLSTDTVGGNQSGSDDNGFNSLGFANTGLAFAPSLSNVLIFRWGYSAFPFREVSGFERLQLGVDLFWHNKLVKDAPIDEPTGNDRFLGIEGDVYMNYRVTSDLSLSVRYGMFFPGTGITGETDVRNFLFVGATLAF